MGSGEPPVRAAGPDSADGRACRAIDRLSPPMRIILILTAAAITRALRFSICLLAREAPEIAVGRGQAGWRSWLARCSIGIAGSAFLASAVFAGWVEVAGVHHYGLVEICIAALAVASAPALFWVAANISDSIKVFWDTAVATFFSIRVSAVGPGIRDGVSSLRASWSALFLLRAFFFSSFCHA